MKNKAPAKKGFTLIDLLVSLSILGTILIFAIREYSQHVAAAKLSRAKADVEELLQSVRLYNIREDKAFDKTVFAPKELGNFIGTYLEKEPPKDPWGNYYRHEKNIGAVYSTGEDGIDQTTEPAPFSDDVVLSYLPAEFFLVKTEYVDANLDNLINFGDYLLAKFSRPVKLEKPVVIDFETTNPAKALGSALVKKTQNPYYVKIELCPPVNPSFIIGETRLYCRAVDSITDLSPLPKMAVRGEGALIEKQKK